MLRKSDAVEPTYYFIIIVIELMDLLYTTEICKSVSFPLEVDDFHAVPQLREWRESWLESRRFPRIQTKQIHNFVLTERSFLSFPSQRGPSGNGIMIAE